MPIGYRAGEMGARCKGAAEIARLRAESVRAEMRAAEWGMRNRRPVDRPRLGEFVGIASGEWGR